MYGSSGLTKKPRASTLSSFSLLHACFPQDHPRNLHVNSIASSVQIQQLTDSPAVQMYGSSGWTEKPRGSTLASFTSCFPQDHPQNLHVKTIANTRHTLSAGADPHHFLYAEPYYAVNTDHERVDGAKSGNVTVDKVQPSCRLFGLVMVHRKCTAYAACQACSTPQRLQNTALQRAAASC